MLIVITITMCMHIMHTYIYILHQVQKIRTKHSSY